MDEYKQLLDCNLWFVPRIRTRSYLRYSIVIVEDIRVTVDIDGYPIYRTLNREICPPNETMNVWLDRPAFNLSGTINNLVIQIL